MWNMRDWNELAELNIKVRLCNIFNNYSWQTNAINAKWKIVIYPKINIISELMKPNKQIAKMFKWLQKDIDICRGGTK